MKKRIRLGIERKRHLLIATRRSRKWFRKTDFYRDTWVQLQASAEAQIGPLRPLPVTSACWVPFNFEMHQPPANN